MTSRITDTRRIEHALQEIFTHEQIPFPDRQAYIDQAREVSETYGADYCEQWLQAYAEDARTRQAAWSRARAAAAAIINSRHPPAAKPDRASTLALANPSNASAAAHPNHISTRRTVPRQDNPYAAARAGRPHAPMGQEAQQPTLL